MATHVSIKIVKTAFQHWLAIRCETLFSKIPSREELSVLHCCRESWVFETGHSAFMWIGFVPERIYMGKWLCSAWAHLGSRTQVQSGMNNRACEDYKRSQAHC
jgi:hypothetical protein